MILAWKLKKFTRCAKTVSSANYSRTSPNGHHPSADSYAWCQRTVSAYRRFVYTFNLACSMLLHVRWKFHIKLKNPITFSVGSTHDVQVIWTALIWKNSVLQCIVKFGTGSSRPCKRLRWKFTPAQKENQKHGCACFAANIPQIRQCKIPSFQSQLATTLFLLLLLERSYVSYSILPKRKQLKFKRSRSLAWLQIVNFSVSREHPISTAHISNENAT